MTERTIITIFSFAPRLTRSRFLYTSNYIYIHARVCADFVISRTRTSCMINAPRNTSGNAHAVPRRRPLNTPPVDNLKKTSSAGSRLRATGWRGHERDRCGEAAIRFGLRFSDAIVTKIPFPAAIRRVRRCRGGFDERRRNRMKNGARIAHGRTGEQCILLRAKKNIICRYRVRGAKTRYTVFGHCCFYSPFQKCRGNYCRCPISPAATTDARAQQQQQ